MKLTFIFKAFISSLWRDFKYFYNSFGKPSKLLNTFFYVAILLYITERYVYLKVAVVVWVFLYVWKLGIDSGDYMKKYRDDYKKRIK